MPKEKIGKPHVRILLFNLVWWIVGVVTASIWGLGWFFFVETLRRIITYFPPFRNRLRVIFFGEDIVSVTPAISSVTKNISDVMGGVIIIAWIVLTIIVFMKANVSLIVIIENLRTAK